MNITDYTPGRAVILSLAHNDADGMFLETIFDVSDETLEVLVAFKKLRDSIAFYEPYNNTDNLGVIGKHFECSPADAEEVLDYYIELVGMGAEDHANYISSLQVVDIVGELTITKV